MFKAGNKKQNRRTTSADDDWISNCRVGAFTNSLVYHFSLDIYWSSKRWK
jgi:hypothetical protein